MPLVVEFIAEFDDRGRIGVHLRMEEHRLAIGVRCQLLKEAHGGGSQLVLFVHDQICLFSVSCLKKLSFLCLKLVKALLVSTTSVCVGISRESVFARLNSTIRI
jgi:hypothetical protein